MTLKRRIKYFFFKLHPKSVYKYFVKDLKLKDSSPWKLALSFAIGAFFSVCPTWGYQAALAGLVASVFKLNKIAAMGTTALSVAPLVPVILLTSFRLGAWVIGGPVPDISFQKFPGWKNLGLYAWQYLLGSLILATLLSAVVFVLMLVILSVARSILRKRKQAEPVEQ